ncbi:MAG: hypothetical protein V4631_12955 [Pseudomonadota bacterium]
MKLISSKRLYPKFHVPVLAFVILLSSCSKASEPPTKTTYVTPSGWQTICLDRFLIDLPVSVEMAATKEKFKGAYGFDGIHDIGGNGLRWGKVAIGETFPSSPVGYRRVYDDANARQTSEERYREWFREQEATIQEDAKDAQSGTPEEIIAAKSRLEKKKKSLEASRYSHKVSGKAILSENQAFAFRRGFEFSVGYLDQGDRRIRTFEGAISQRQIESPDAAAFEYRRFMSIYHRRAPTEIPRSPGFCTAFGLIDEAAGPESDTSLEIPFRSAKYPNLIFRLVVVPADLSVEKNIQEMPSMYAEQADLHLVGILEHYGPVASSILGSPGRTVGFTYGPNCSKSSCRPADQVYEIEAETFGVPQRPDRPHLKLHMVAATSDDYKLKRPLSPGEPSYNTPSRPALSGHVPPPFEEGKKIFEQVLRSIRLRPGAIAASAGVTARSPPAEQIKPK